MALNITLVGLLCAFVLISTIQAEEEIKGKHADRPAKKYDLERCFDDYGTEGHCKQDCICTAEHATKGTCHGKKVCCHAPCKAGVADPCILNNGNVGICEEHGDCTDENPKKGSCSADLYCCKSCKLEPFEGEGDICTDDDGSYGVCIYGGCGKGTKDVGRMECDQGNSCCVQKDE